MQNPLVTLYMLSYNRKQYVEEAFESMLRQTYSPLEIIVSDDHSTDGTFEIIQRMASAYKGQHHLRISQNDRNLGLLRNLNKVFVMMRGELLIMNCDDDISMPNKVSRIVAAWIKNNRRPTSIASSSIVIDQYGRETGRNVLGKERLVSRSLFSFMRLGCPNGMYGRTGAAFAYSKSVIDTFGPITTRFTADDLVMVRRAYLLGPLLIIPDILFKYRIGVGLSTQRHISFRKEAIRQRWSYNALRQTCLDVKIVLFPEKVSSKLSKILVREKEMERFYSKMWRMGLCARLLAFCITTRCGFRFCEFPRQTVRLGLRALKLL